ncbi:hypothetical protein D3C78_1070090 [compost metagenome]
MTNELWLLTCVTLFITAVQLCLSGRSQRSLDEATMLPFADDAEVAERMEQATGRSRTGCACPGSCRGRCEDWQRFTA